VSEERWKTIFLSTPISSFSPFTFWCLVLLPVSLVYTFPVHAKIQLLETKLFKVVAGNLQPPKG
jgi:hypothetical protein